MKARLTLTLDNEVIAAAKKHARANNTTLSKLIENHLKSIIVANTSDKNYGEKISCKLGVIELPEDYNYKFELTSILTKKYSM